MANQVYYNPYTGQSYTLGQQVIDPSGSNLLTGNQTQWNSYIKNGQVKILGGTQQQQTPSYTNPTAPATGKGVNQTNNMQLGIDTTAINPNDMGAREQAIRNQGFSTPRWEANAYANKISRMGGNANDPMPYNITNSGFPWLGGDSGMQGGKGSPQQQPYQQQGGKGQPSYGQPSYGMGGGIMGQGPTPQNIWRPNSPVPDTPWSSTTKTDILGDGTPKQSVPFNQVMNSLPTTQRAGGGKSFAG